MSGHHDNCLGAASIKVNSTVTLPPLDMSLHAENRQRLVQALKNSGAKENSIVFLQGGASENRHDTDHEPLFRQESFFHWAFGVKEPDWYGIIDINTGKSTLFCPRLPEVYATWMGHIRTTDEWKEEYQTDEVKYTDEISSTISTDSVLLLLRGINSDSKNEAKPGYFKGIESYKTDEKILFPAITECRVIKSKKEQDLLRFINTVSSEAHLAVMQHTKTGLKEYQLESLFRHWCYYHGGARFMSYTCICASGHNGSVLHYGHSGEPNSKGIKDGDMCLFDMGAEFHCYGSDITTSYPANGVFTEDQKLIYQTVLDSQLAVMGALKPGVSWVDMHELAYRVILAGLKKGGILTGEIDAMLNDDVGSVFMPHGLGHFLGIDTHDCGGYPEGVKRPTKPGFSSLRTARVMEPGMYITVEPGVYFIDHLLNNALKDEKKKQYINEEVLARFRNFGGVRIEDNVLITENGCENFTHSPRTIEDIEAVFQGKITQRNQLKKFY